MGHGSCACVWVSEFRTRWGGIALLGLASLPSLRSLAWNCALAVGGSRLSPPCARWRGIALFGLGGWPPPLGLGSGLATVYVSHPKPRRHPNKTL